MYDVKTYANRCLATTIANRLSGQPIDVDTFCDNYIHIREKVCENKLHNAVTCKCGYTKSDDYEKCEICGSKSNISQTSSLSEYIMFAQDLSEFIELYRSKSKNLNL